ncbi:MAG: glycosyltransferase family 4 protein, partial [Actinomycetota bacterium]|nr:glycosyltransferase family 4 protein [Actinomycetota bacterium]
GGYDLVLANSHWTHVDAAVAARIWRVPTVLTLHETSVPGLGRRLRDLAVAAAGHTIAVSESVADTVGAGVRGRVSVIPNGVDTSVFTPPDDEARREVRRELGITESQRVALAATRIDPSKHIEDLVDLAAACDESVTVLVAGTTSGHGDYERRVRERAAALPPGRIRFLGARDDIPRLLGAADLYLHTGLIEGMPLGVIEAQSAGVPVAAYEAAGVRESLRDGETGYVVAPGDVDGLVRAARRVFGSAHLRRELGAAARTHVLHRHRLDAQASANAQVLRAVCRPATRARVGAP